MKRIGFILMLITGVATVVTGALIGAPGHGGAGAHHHAAAAIFIVLCIVHGIMNRRAAAAYFRGKRTSPK